MVFMMQNSATENWSSRLYAYQYTSHLHACVCGDAYQNSELACQIGPVIIYLHTCSLSIELYNFVLNPTCYTFSMTRSHADYKH